jgi:hypothetical protein
MTDTSEAEFAVELSRLAARQGATPAGTPEGTDDLLASVRAFHDLARIATDLQGQAARTAHEAGVSWGRIGALLGISRQAVQQRFDPNYAESQPPTARTRVLGPVTRAEEMHHLTVAGTQGWRLTQARHGEHTLEHVGGAWDITRVSVFSPRPLPAADDGWEAAATRFPDCFYVRARQPGAIQPPAPSD